MMRSSNTFRQIINGKIMHCLFWEHDYFKKPPLEGSFLVEHISCLCSLAGEVTWHSPHPGSVCQGPDPASQWKRANKSHSRTPFKSLHFCTDQSSLQTNTQPGNRHTHTRTRTHAHTHTHTHTPPPGGAADVRVTWMESGSTRQPWAALTAPPVCQPEIRPIKAFILSSSWT